MYSFDPQKIFNKRLKWRNGAKSHIIMSKFWDRYWLTKRRKNLTFWLCTSTWEDYNHLRHSKSLCCKAMVPWRRFEGIIDTLWWSKKFSESRTAPLKLPKVVKSEEILAWLGVSFLKKMKNFWFSCNKNGLTRWEMS